MSQTVSLLAVQEAAKYAYPDLKWSVERPFHEDRVDIIAEGEVKVGRSTYPTRVAESVSGLELFHHPNTNEFLATVIDRVARQAMRWP